MQHVVEIRVEGDLGLHYLRIVFAAKTLEEGHFVLQTLDDEVLRGVVLQLEHRLRNDEFLGK